MPEVETDVQSTESSAVESQDVTVAESSPAEDLDVNAESSAAEGETAPSFVDVINKALGNEESPASGETRETKPQEPKPEKVDDLPEDPTPEEIKGMTPPTRKRVEQLLDQRRDLKEKLDQVEPKARQWDHIENFRVQNGLTSQAVANAIQIAGLIENDPERAYQVIAQLYNSLASRVGAAIPDDLREAVKRGEITAHHAQELSRAKATAAFTRQQQQALEERRRQEAEAARITGYVDSLAGVSDAWDKAKAASDPDWMLKRQLVSDQAQLRLRREGLPQTAEALRKILDEEASKVDGFVGKFRPPARAVTPSPTGGSTRNAAPARPKSLLDAINQALDG